jgi:hypothetical protein
MEEIEKVDLRLYEEMGGEKAAYKKETIMPDWAPMSMKIRP